MAVVAVAELASIQVVRLRVRTVLPVAAVVALVICGIRQPEAVVSLAKVIMAVVVIAGAAQVVAVVVPELSVRTELPMVILELVEMVYRSQSRVL
jgi:hypothetical protein